MNVEECAYRSYHGMRGGGKKAKKARLENHDIDAPTGPFPYGPLSIQHVAEKAGDSAGICFVD